MTRLIVAAGLLAATSTSLMAQAPSEQSQPDDIRILVSQLDLQKYKETIRGLTQFGDRREGTERNRRAVDWIEAQLKSYGCETGRLTYDPENPTGEPPAPPAPCAAAPAAPDRAAKAGGHAGGSDSPRGGRQGLRRPNRRQSRSNAAAGRGPQETQRRSDRARP